VVHVRIVAPRDSAERALELLGALPAVCNVVYFPGAAQRPEGDLIMCDVPRREASVLLDDLRELQIHHEGSISLTYVDTEISDAADEAEKAVADLPFADEVVWENVESRTSEETQLSINFVEFMMIATLIAGVGILLDSPILIIGAMVVGPDFGPVAATCVAVVERRIDLARRSFTALAVAFPAAVAVTILWSLVFKWTDLASDGPQAPHPLTAFISDPDFFSFFIAWLAGTAGVLSLTSTKSGALVGVLISVTTVPALGDIGVSIAYADWSECRGAATQLGVNLVGLFGGGIARLYVQRRMYEKRRLLHRKDAAAREAAGRPLGAGDSPRGASRSRV
jgi:uncharacterized hydrophobic protein (TIGR00271 family)